MNELFPTGKCYLGGDPGKSGAIAVISADQQTLDIFKTPQNKDPIHTWLELTQEIAAKYPVLIGFVEKPNVGAGGKNKKGKQGTSQLVKQGVNIAYMMMAIAAAKIPFTPLAPATWTGQLGLRKGKASSTVWKTELYEQAKRFYPKHEFPKYAADAVLIAEICRRFDGIKPKTVRVPKKKEGPAPY